MRQLTKEIGLGYGFGKVSLSSLIAVGKVGKLDPTYFIDGRFS